MKLPRDISGKELIKILKKYGYKVSRQRGSHIRLTIELPDKIHNITIPNSKPIKIGTLNSIINDLAAVHSLSKDELINKLFE